jgi:hypothetical protein
MHICAFQQFNYIYTPTKASTTFPSIYSSFIAFGSNFIEVLFLFLEELYTQET